MAGGFLFGGDTGVQSAAELARKREIVNALLDPSMTMPQSFGEGLTVFGRAIAGKLQDKKLSAKEDAERARAMAEFSGLPGVSGSGAGGGGGGYGGASYTPPTDMPKADLSGISGMGNAGISLPGAKPADMGMVGNGGLSFGGTKLPPGQAEIRAGLISRGYSEAAADGIMMNMADESGFNPAAVGDNGNALGLAQWNGPRKAALEAFAAQQGKPPTDIGVQLDFLDMELKGSEAAAGSALMSSKTAPEAAAVFLNQFERPAETHRARREADYLGGSPSVTASASGGGQPAMGMDIAKLSELAANRYLPEEQRAIVWALIQQAMTPPDPMSAIELEKAQLELAQMKDPGKQPPIEVGGVLLDPATMQPIFDSRQPDAGTNVTVNNGDGDTGKYIYGTDAGVPAGWRVDMETGVASPIPGGPADVEQKQLADKKDKTSTQGKLKLGTTLESINLNISEIENGGLPVTGALGDARRTWLGRALTGDSAMDFGNRTNQITDQAALSEVQNMRDNSPTGGAVGSLTDSERIAIGNSVTALNNSTSAEEYARAARAYRKLALDTAYGEGMWHLDENGAVIAGPDPSGASGAAPTPEASADAEGWTTLPSGIKVRVKP